MSNIGELLANIGGAVSAQATGGSAGLQQFMATLAQQQAQQSSQDFKREAREREQAFTLHRDRLQRQHEREQLDTRLSAERREETERYAGQAAAINSFARSNPQNQAIVEEHLRKVLPGLGLVEAPLDWTDTESIMGLLKDAAKAGFQISQAHELGETRRINDDWYLRETNNTLRYTNESDLIKHKQNHAVAANRLNELRSSAGLIQQDIAALDDDKSRSLNDSYARATAIRERIEDLGQRYENLVSSEQFGAFFAPGTSLSGEASNFAGLTSSIGDALATAQGNLAIDTVGAWSPGEPTDYPGLVIGYGGAKGEEDNFLHSMRSQSFKAHKAGWNGQAAYLKDMPVADQQYIDPPDRELVSDLQEYVAGDGRLDLESLMTDLRSAVVTGNDVEATRLSDLVSRVHHFDKAGKDLTIARGRARKKATTEVLAISNQFRHKTRLGYPLFASAEEARNAVDAYGIPDEQYPDQRRGPGTEAERLDFLQKIVGSDDGITKMATHLFTGLQGDGEVLTDIALDQLQLKGDQILKALQLEDRPEIKEKLYSRLRELTGTDKSATIEAQGGAIAEIHDYNSTNLERVSRGTSYYGSLPLEEKERYRKDYINEVFSVVPTPEQMSDTLRHWINEFRGERPEFEQPSAWWFEQPEYKGEEKRLRLNQEAAAEAAEVASFYDLFDLWRRKDETFADLQDEAGRVSDQAFPIKIHGWGHMARKERRPRDWAKGEAGSYLRGDESYSNQYEAVTPSENIDHNIVNQLGFLDYMRGVDLSSARLPSLTAEERTMMVGIQNHLREMSYGAALRAIHGDETTGKMPTGFPFADLGLRIASADTAADATSLREPESLRDRAINIDAERRAINRAQRQLADLTPGTTSYFDVDPRDEHVEYEILSETAIEQEQAALKRAEDTLTAMDLAKQSSLAQSLRPRIGKVLSGKDFSDPESLAKILSDELPRITGTERDPVLDTESPVHPLLERIATANTSSEAINAMIDVFAETTTSHAQKQAVSLATMTKTEFREAVLKEAKMDYGTIGVQIRTIAHEIGLRSQDGEFNASRLPTSLQNHINTEAFNNLAKDVGDPGTNVMLALHVWSAHQAVLSQGEF